MLNRRRGLIATLAVVASLCLTAVAAAYTLVYFEGWTTSTLGPKHSITETSVRDLYGYIACTSAKNLDYTQAGTAYCTSGYNTVTAHPYNGSMRYGWCGTPQGYTSGYMRCREDYG